MMTEEPENKHCLAQLAIRHPALSASALYVLASVIGMFYSWAYLREFGINVFNYAQIGDFLLASLKEPMIWAFVIATVLVILGDNWMSRRVQRKSRSRWTAWYGSPGYRRINYFVALSLVLFLIYVLADTQARDTRAGGGKIVTVTYADRAADDNVILLGTTGSFVFLFEAKFDQVQIHPHESIHSIIFESAE